MEFTTFSKLRDYDLLSPQWIRIGMIPYMQFQKNESNTEYIYGLAIDMDHNTYIDFGGHREDYDSDIVETLYREVSEEAFGLFDYITRKDYLNSPCVNDDNSILVFIQIEDNYTYLSNAFNDQVRLSLQENQKPESRALVWVTEKYLIHNLKKYADQIGKFIYPITGNLLCTAFQIK